MAFFGMVRVNGVPRFGMAAQFADGTLSAPAIAFANQPNLGFARAGTDQVVFESGGVRALMFQDGVGIRMRAVNSLQWSATTDAAAAGDTVIVREAINTVKFYDGSTSASTVLLGNIDFRQAASTFAQTATITNGPRAANPIAWIECKVSGSTGRIPVW